MKPNAMNRTTICLVLSENYKKRVGIEILTLYKT